jgi:hypothetical protein
MAAHSASAQVITIASAVGRVVDVLCSSVGAASPTALKSIAGNAGVLLIFGEKLVCLAEVNRRAGL